ncbi:MAG: sulfotransferase domain-containing protein [Chloroflexi bacterium]|nr:sulfotransferase domain-containing protein [Chloroflexota bacterium]
MLGRIINVTGEELKYNFVYLRHQMATGANQRAKVLVNGSPKSGTTWMLKMIASQPGYQTVGNFDRDIERYHSVQPGDVVHGHDWYSSELKEILEGETIKVILMLRDPRDQLISRMFHVKRSPKHMWHDRIQSMSEEEALMVCIEGREGLPGTDKMITLTQTWLNNNAEAICIKYEELLANPVVNFSKVLRYIGVEKNVESLAGVIVDRNRFERLSMGRRIWQSGRKPGEENSKSHFRKGITGDWKNYMKPAHIARFKEIAGQQLIELGYEKDMNWTL